METSHRTPAFTLIAIIATLVAALAFAPQANADNLIAAQSTGATSAYALLKSDGYLVPCSSSGVEISDTWEGNCMGGKLNNVQTVFIAPNVTIINSSSMVKYAEPYGYKNDVFEVSISFEAKSSSGQGYGGLPKLSEVKFLPGSQCRAIGREAFEDASNLVTIHLPDTIRSINFQAFHRCSSLSDITFGNSLASIGQEAFGQCTSLAEVDLPASCSSLYRSDAWDSAAFQACSNLRKVTLRSMTLVSDPYGGKLVTDVFYNTPLLMENNNTFVYVPTRALYAYRNHFGLNGKEGEGWSKFNQSHLDKLRGIDGEPTDISGASVTLSQTNYTYDGKAKTPAVTVTFGSSTLKKGASANDYATADYTVAYENNVNAGTGTVTVTGIGLYTGTETATFTITRPANAGKGGNSGNNGGASQGGSKNSAGKKANTLEVSPKTAKVSKSKKTKTIKRAKVLAVSKAQGTVTYKKLSGNKKITINSKRGNVKLRGGLQKNTYKVKVRVTAAGNSEYNSGSRTVTFKVRIR